MNNPKNIKLIKAKTNQINELTNLIAQYHSFEGIKTTETHRENSILPLLNGSPHGEAYLIYIDGEPVGYIVISCGWSIELGGKDAVLDEFFMIPNARSKGIGSMAIDQLLKILHQSDYKAISLEVAHDNSRAIHFYQKFGYKLRAKYHFMTRSLDE